ncbi:MAG: hypothetical protein ACKO1Z_04010 [Actinomycetota bacterium]
MIPPPVEFACDSFSLTSPGVGAEYVLLDPFSGSIEIYDSVLDDARARAASDDDDDDEDDEGGRADRRRRRRRRRRARHNMPPRRTLFSVDDYFGLDLEEYFGARTPFSSHADDDDDRRRGRPRLRRGGEGNDDAIVDWIGLDTCVSVDDFRGTTIVGAKRPALQLPRPPLLTPLLLLRDGEFDNAHLGVPDDLVEIYPKWKNFHKNLNYNQLRQLVGALPPSTTLGFISVGIRGWSTAAVAIPPFSVAPLSAKVAVDRRGRPTLSRSRHGLRHRRRHHQVRRASFQRG